MMDMFAPWLVLALAIANIVMVIAHQILVSMLSVYAMHVHVEYKHKSQAELDRLLTVGRGWNSIAVTCSMSLGTYCLLLYLFG